MAERGLASIGRSANRLNRSMGRMAGKGFKLAAGIGAATAAFAAFGAIRFIKDSSKTAADFELMATGFKSILGSSEKAAERMKELTEFSVKTPFEPSELMRASKMLQALGGDTIATGKGLELIGDAASAATKPLEMVALHAGRMFQGLTQGTAFGESLSQLQQMGVLSKGAFIELRTLSAQQTSGARSALSNAEALEKMKGALGGVSGAMADLAQTTAGKVSTMRGNLDLLKIAFGQGVNDGLEEGVDRFNSKAPEYFEAAKKLGDGVGLAIGEAFKGNTKLLELQITLVMQKLAEVAAAVFLQTMTTIVGQAWPNFELAMIEKVNKSTENIPILGSIFKGVGAMRSVGPNLLKKHSPVGQFDFSDFHELVKSSTNDMSENTLATLKEMLEEIKKGNKERPMEHARRDVENSAYGNLVYIK